MRKVIIAKTIRLDIRYLNDGSVEWSYFEPDPRKSPRVRSKMAKWMRRASGIIHAVTGESFRHVQFDSDLGPVSCVAGKVAHDLHSRDIWLKVFTQSAPRGADSSHTIPGKL